MEMNWALVFCRALYRDCSAGDDFTRTGVGGVLPYFCMGARGGTALIIQASPVVLARVVRPT